MTKNKTEKRGELLKQNSAKGKVYNLRCQHCGEILLEKEKKEFTATKLPHYTGKYYMHKTRNALGKNTYCGPLIIIRILNKK